MKKFATTFLVVAMMVFSANLVFADVNQNQTLNNDIRIGDTTATATVGDITNTNRNRNDNTLTLVTNEAPNFIVAPLLSTFVSAPTSEAGKGWKQIKCDPDYQEFTLGELRSMANSGRFLDKRGSFWNAITSVKVKGTAIKEYTGKVLSDDTVIRVLNRIPSGSGSRAKKIGYYEGMGDYGWPADEIFAKTVIRAVEKTGATNVVVLWDFVVDRRNSSSSIGIGYSSSTSDGNTAGSGSIGASFGNTYSLTEIAYQMKVFAYENVGPQPNSCGLEQTSYKAPAPQVKACNPDEIQKDIMAEEGIYCPNLNMNNLERNLRIAYLDIDEYLCTGDKTFLRHKYIVESTGKDFNGAIGHFERAQKNLPALEGKERVNAQAKMAEAYKAWGYAILKTEGPEAADKFAEKHGSKYYTELK